MNPIAKFIKENRKAAGLTQEEFAIRSGLGLRFVRELEQGKETVRMPTRALFPKPTRGTPSSTTEITCAPKAQAPCR